MPLASADNASNDISSLFAAFEGDLSSAYLIMSPSNAATIGLGNSLADVGARGGTLGGVPVVTSRHIEADSTGSAVILLDASQVMLASGPVETAVATHASVQMAMLPPATPPRAQHSLFAVANGFGGNSC